MIIYFSPQLSGDKLSIVRAGDVLTINNEDFDFAQVEDGDMLPKLAISSDWFAGDVVRVNGRLEVTLRLPIPLDFSHAQAFPTPMYINYDGEVSLPQ